MTINRAIEKKLIRGNGNESQKGVKEGGAAGGTPKKSQKMQHGGTRKIEIQERKGGEYVEKNASLCEPGR